MTSRSLRLTSAPVLAGALVVLTILAAGPLRPLDAALQGYWARRYTPNWFAFLDSVPNAIAGQAVCLPILLVIAIVIARRHRTWHPLAIVVAAEVAFYAGIGGMKILLSRSSPAAGVGHFWEGGMFEHGWYGIAYPSGHAAEAILFYGTAAYLLRTYTNPDTRIRGRLNVLVGLITVNATVVAFYLGFHWPTDLLAGVLAGALMLRIIVDTDRRVAAGLPILGWQPPAVLTALAGRPGSAPVPAPVVATSASVPTPSAPTPLPTPTEAPAPVQSANDLPPLPRVPLAPVLPRSDETAATWMRPGRAPFVVRHREHRARAHQLQTTGKG